MRQPAPKTVLFRTRTAIWVFLGLYAATLAVLAWQIQTRPGFAYNWEAYTVRGLLDYMANPDRSVLDLNEGLMTDSGRSVVVVLPSWLGMTLLGQTWTGLRLPIIAIAAFAPPLTWLLGRKLYSDVVGLTGAALVATSQVFLLYGRTATNVGMSLVPALCGFICLWMCVRQDPRRLGLWLALMQVSLVINSYFYSPIRFLWLIALVLFAVEVILRKGERAHFALAFAITVVVLPIAIIVLRPGPPLTPQDAVRGYYYGRGEQIFRINDDPGNYLPYLNPKTDEERAKLAEASKEELAIRLIRRNAEDLLNLLVDRNTDPAITDYWNPTGRLMPRVLVPFLIAGSLLLLWRFFREPRARLLLALLTGFSLPLLLTSQVHIGRLIYIVPVVALISAVPIEYAMGYLAGRRSDAIANAIWSWAAIGAGGLLVIAATVPTWQDWSTEFPVPRMHFVAERIESLERDYPGSQFVYVFGDLGGYEVEGLRVGELEMMLHGDLEFVDLLTNQERGSGDNRFLYGAIGGRLTEPDAIPGFCTNLYLLEPNQVEMFITVTEPIAQAECGQSLVFNELR